MVIARSDDVHVCILKHVALIHDSAINFSRIYKVLFDGRYVYMYCDLSPLSTLPSRTCRAMESDDVIKIWSLGRVDVGARHAEHLASRRHDGGLLLPQAPPQPPQHARRPLQGDTARDL